LSTRNSAGVDREVVSLGGKTEPVQYIMGPQRQQPHHDGASQGQLPPAAFQLFDHQIVYADFQKLADEFKK